MASSDHYETLGLTPDATAEDIKRAFRRLAAEHHPDKNPGDEDAAERFKRISEAYTVLSDPAARTTYDRDAPSQPEPAAPAPYLRPPDVCWTTRFDTLPEPVTVCLCNHGGCQDITEFGPHRTSGSFWHLESGEIVLSDESICNFIIVPSLESVSAGTHTDQVAFSIDGVTAELTIRLELAPAPRRTPPGTAASDTDPPLGVSMASGIGAPSTATPASLAPAASTVAAIAGVMGLVLLGIWSWKHPADFFGLILWIAPLLFLAIACIIVIGCLTDGFGTFVGAIVVSFLALIVVWIVYSIAVSIWTTAAGTSQHCPSLVGSLPSGEHLCDPQWRNGNAWGPPLFHFWTGE